MCMVWLGVPSLALQGPASDPVCLFPLATVLYPEWVGQRQGLKEGGHMHPYMQLLDGGEKGKRKKLD